MERRKAEEFHRGTRSPVLDEGILRRRILLRDSRGIFNIQRRRDIRASLPLRRHRMGRRDFRRMGTPPVEEMEHRVRTRSGNRMGRLGAFQVRALRKTSGQRQRGKARAHTHGSQSGILVLASVCFYFSTDTITFSNKDHV